MDAADFRKLAETTLEAWHDAKGSHERARAVIAVDGASALELLVAAKILLGEGFLVWEPETLWLSLPELHDASRDKLLAAIAIMVQPTFFVDMRVFGHTCNAFTDDVVIPGDFPHPSIPGMVWTVIQALLISGLEAEDSAEWSDDILGFMAARCASEGFAQCPPEINIAQEFLNKLLSEDGHALAAKIKKSDEASATSKDEALEVQTSRLTEVDLYVDDRLADAVSGLLLLT